MVSAGSTATVALLRDGIELVVGSVGDSRAMLCRKAKALKLTSDHTPERKDEKERYGRYPGLRKTGSDIHLLVAVRLGEEEACFIHHIRH